MSFYQAVTIKRVNRVELWGNDEQTKGHKFLHVVNICKTIEEARKLAYRKNSDIFSKVTDNKSKKKQRKVAQSSRRKKIYAKRNSHYPGMPLNNYQNGNRARI